MEDTRMSSEMSAPTAPPGPPSRPSRRRLVRSSHDRLWAGVAGGVAEYFDLDPSLVRLLFVLAAIVTWGAAVALYIVAWIILPRDDRPPESGPTPWRDWSSEFHNETHRLAEEARRVAEDVRGHPTSTGADPAATPSTTASDEPDPWWQSERHVERHHHSGPHPRTAGIALVTIGVLFLAANAGLFSWIQWHTIWPVFLIALGLMLFARQGGWRR
jgi:phage shock protein PspC (stress-responsive transcriptional regulator)